MDVSIIIVNHNSFQILKNCIDSILLYTSAKIEFEIIIVDNNSDEGDIALLLEKYNCVKLILNKENRGFAAANNQGIQITRGEYLLLLNNDTLFIEDCISKILQYYEEFGQNNIIGCRLLNEDKSIQESILDKDTILNSIGENFFIYKLLKCSRKWNRWYYNNVPLQLPTEVDIIKGAFIFCPKKIVNDLGGFDERFYFYAEETDFCMRAYSSGYKVYYLPKARIIHYGGFSTNKNLWFKFKNQSIARIQIFQKHYRGLNFYLLILFHYSGIGLRVFLYFLRGTATLDHSFLVKSFYYLRQLFIYPQNLFKNS